MGKERVKFAWKRMRNQIAAHSNEPGSGRMSVRSLQTGLKQHIGRIFSARVAALPQRRKTLFAIR